MKMSAQTSIDNKEEEELDEFAEGIEDSTVKVTHSAIQKEMGAVPKAEDTAKRYKEILLERGFHKKQNGDDKEQYVKKEEEEKLVIGCTFTKNLITGKFWALKDNNFLEPEDVKKLKAVQEFHAAEAAQKRLTLGNAPAHTIDVETKRGLEPSKKEVGESPNAIINEAQLMATALYNVVEKQHLYQPIQGKKYLQLEAWQLLGKFCNVQGIVEEVQPVEYFGVKGFGARAAVIDDDGRKIAEAEAVCMRDEPNWKAKPLFQLKSMAQTRALSKAYRSCLSFIVSIAGYSPTPLEEMYESG